MIMTKPNEIKCPCCDTVSSYENWYDLSNDYYAICPSCDNTVQFDEFEENTHISNIL